MRAHLNGCPVCRAEVSELRLVVAALAEADPDRIDEYPLPPGDLEESTFAPILGEIHRNDRGQVVGYSWTDPDRSYPFLWQNGKMRDLGPLGGPYSDAYGINNRGQIVGYSYTASGKSHGVLWSR